jgi:hypothetical protein
VRARPKIAPESMAGQGREDMVVVAGKRLFRIGGDGLS